MQGVNGDCPGLKFTDLSPGKERDVAETDWRARLKAFRSGYVATLADTISRILSIE